MWYLKRLTGLTSIYVKENKQVFKVYIKIVAPKRTMLHDARCMRKNHGRDGGIYFEKKTFMEFS